MGRWRPVRHLNPREITPMSSYSNVESYAWLILNLVRRPDGKVEALVYSALPGCDDLKVTFRADVANPDEMFSCLADFHNEWRGQGSLLDCVLDDWANH